MFGHDDRAPPPLGWVAERVPSSRWDRAPEEPVAAVLGEQIRQGRLDERDGFVLVLLVRDQAHRVVRFPMPQRMHSGNQPSNP
jgi:hypothetical protein